MKGKIIFGTHRKPDRYFVDDVECSEETYRAAFPPKQTEFSSESVPNAFGDDWNKPVVSDGLAVLPKRIKQAEAICRKNSVPTDFTTKQGRPILRNKAHRTQVMKILSEATANKFVDRDGFYD